MTPIGIIGCGGHAMHHAEHFGSYFFPYGVWDPSDEAMVKSGFSRKFKQLEDLLADKEIVAVMICSPDDAHLEQIEVSLNAGKHVFCEKPLLVPGQDIQDLEKMFDLAQANKLILTSCHPRRYDRPIWWLHPHVSRRSSHREFIARFGQVLSFHFDFSYHAPSNEWKHTRSLLLDHINHEVDLMNCLFGIQGFNAWKINDNFDRYDVVGERDDGISFHFQGTRRLKERNYPEWCRVRFERGEVVLDMMMGVAYINDHEKKTIETISGLGIDYDGRLQKVMRDFHESIYDSAWGYLSREEMLMNTEAGILLQNEGIQRINIRRAV
jgi:predicted dehydrogenase